MRVAVFGIAVALSVAWTVHAQSPSGSDTGRITGQIVTAYAELIADASVTLARVDEPGFPARTTKSDSRGAFSFAQLPPGRYRLLASKAGYTSRQLSSVSTGSAGALSAGPVVDVGLDAPVDVQVLVRRAASIAGRIIRPDGSAAANVRVVAAVGSGTRRQPLFEVQTTSQSDGRYEIRGLPPGEYLVGAGSVAVPTKPFDDTEAGQAARKAAAAASATAHTSWYPGVTDQEPGTAVTLLEGVSAEGIDIWLTPSQHFAVAGRVSWPVGIAIEGISIDFGDPAGTRSGVWLVSDPSGIFTLGTVPPGPLTLLARAESDQGTLFGIASIEVSVDSVEDVRILVDRPGLISGRIVYQGSVPPSGRATSVVAEQKLLRVSALYPVPQSSIDADGRFTLPNTIGEYEFGLEGLQHGLAIKRVTRNGRVLPMNRISVSPGETIRDIEIVVGR